MGHICAGWEVVCPDGCVRHFPYHNLGDAECDAEVFAEGRCELGLESRSSEANRSACPQGRHAVRSVMLAHDSGLVS